MVFCWLFNGKEPVVAITLGKPNKASDGPVSDWEQSCIESYLPRHSMWDRGQKSWDLTVSTLVLDRCNIRWCKGSCQKKTFFFGRSLPNLFTHPRVFVRFGRTKGEIRVEKGDFRGDLGGFWGVWTLFGNQPPHPPTFGRDLPKKRFFFTPSLSRPPAQTNQCGGFVGLQPPF